jgi:hypothetical protein
MNSNQNNDSQKANTTVKPMVVHKTPHFARTVSADPTISDTQNSTNTTTTNTDKESVKLNTNAPAFVPKTKRDNTSTPVKTESKDSVPITQPTTTVTSTTTTTSTTTSSTTVPSGTTLTATTTTPIYNQGYIPNTTGYQSKLKISNILDPKPYAPPNLMSYPYIGQPPMYGTYQPSPSTKYPTQFFPPGFPAGYQYPGMQMNTYIPTTQPTTTTTNTNPLNSVNISTSQAFVPSNSTTPSPLSTTPQTVPTTTISEKKGFSIDSKAFVPKHMRNQPVSEHKESESNVSTQEKKEEEHKEEHKKEEEKTAEKKEEINKEAAKETSSDNIVEQAQPCETKKEPTKKSRLSDLLDDKKPISVTTSKTATTAVKKPATTSTTSTVTKPKQGNELNQAFDDKRKQLLKQQQTKVTQPVIAPKVTPKKTEQIIAKEEKEEVREALKEVKEPQREQVKQIEEESPIPSDEEDDDKNEVVERFYFIKDDKRTKDNVYDTNYLLSFKNWKICNEKELLSGMLKQHLDSMRIYEDERPKGYRNDKKKHKDNYLTEPRGGIQRGTMSVNPVVEEKTSFIRSTSKLETPLATAGDLGKWGRKDMSEAEKLAQEFKTKMEDARKLDPVKNELTELLNILTVDNYDEVKSKIFEKIKDNVEDQYKFLEVLFKKAVSEKAFVRLYAKICKDLDKEVPQKNAKEVRTSLMRGNLVEKCREIFKVDNSKIDQYIKVSDPEEREAKLKKFLLGNVNFIAELINAKLLSKKIVFQCINNLLCRIEKTDNEFCIIKQINIEAIVILLDKFGVLINKVDHKITPEDLFEFNKKINDTLSKLDVIQEGDKALPGHIKYKIINLIEKRNRSWEESKVDKSSTAQSITEVREEYDSEQRAPKGSSKLDQEIVNAKIRDDLFSWKDHLKNGYPAEEYQWEVTDQLIRKHKNTVGNILYAFGENCIDFIGKHDDIQTAYKYIREIINYYGPKLDKKDKNEIVEVTLYFLENLSDFSLDNNLLVDVWGGVVYLLEVYKIFAYTDLDRLKNITDDQLKTIFEVMNNSLKFYENKKDDKYQDLVSLTLIKANKNLFQSIVIVGK